MSLTDRWQQRTGSPGGTTVDRQRCRRHGSLASVTGAGGHSATVAVATDGSGGGTRAEARRSHPSPDPHAAPRTAPLTSPLRGRGFTLVEMVLVLTLLGIVSAIGLPTLHLGRYRADAAAQQVRSVFQTAQRTSLTRQYDVIVSIDTLKGGLRIAEDVNNNGAIEVSEWKFWRPLGEGNRFGVPPVGVNGVVRSAVVGAQLRTVDNLPSVIFHRDGSASTDAEVYLLSGSGRRLDYRAITVTRSTGRSELLRLARSDASATWQTGP